ncbi:hypothetical protein EV424DRAFT_1598106, partial [Suillus variegatus]
ARSAITSRDKWSTDDGNFSYRKFYYRIIDVIRNPPDKAWAMATLQHYNLKLFKDKAGRAAALSTSATSDVGEPDENEDDIALMHKQFALRSANPSSVAKPVSTPPVPASSEMLPPWLRSTKVTSPPVSPSPEPPSPAPPTPKPHPIPKPRPIAKARLEAPKSPAPSPRTPKERPAVEAQAPSSPSPAPSPPTPKACPVPKARPVRKAPSEESTPLPRKKGKVAPPESPLTESEPLDEEVETPVRRLPRQARPKAGCKTATSASAPKKKKGRK